MSDRARIYRVRKRMYKEQKGLCWICGERMAISKSQAGKAAYATFDHIVPKADGGTGERGNLRLAHRKCNALRGTVPFVNILAMQVTADS